MKKLTSLTLGISFVIMAWTGIMLFVCPHGRVAYWSDWRLMGLSKEQYGNLHTTSMIVFVLFGSLHIYYNWKAILSYIRNKKRRLDLTKKELLIAAGINAAVVAGTLLSVQPFSAFLSIESGIKESWTEKYGEPPYGHAEESKLKILCRKEEIDLEKAMELLRSRQIKHSPDMTIKEIADTNRVSPDNIYTIIKEAKIHRNGSANGNSEKIPARLGSRKLKELKSINISEVLSYLKQKGIETVSEESRMKNIADELEKTPVELYMIFIKLPKKRTN